ncbi:hypothetical protein AVEN_229382-1 [Araneus ventricosus]|uniref:Uncharacterized protein n=1 Tax=Araneus ventricosus TaxID=182803 RepID=A0A4Y2T7U9_ARAVE|nr:hypothetical protein AVEN_229382-1 [Araneus ventricosus]
MSSLEYKRCITKGLLTKSKPQPKRKERPKSSGDEQTFCAKKRRKEKEPNATCSDCPPHLVLHIKTSRRQTCALAVEGPTTMPQLSSHLVLTSKQQRNNLCGCGRKGPTLCHSCPHLVLTSKTLKTDCALEKGSPLHYAPDCPSHLVLTSKTAEDRLVRLWQEKGGYYTMHSCPPHLVLSNPAKTDWLWRERGATTATDYIHVLLKTSRRQTCAAGLERKGPLHYATVVLILFSPQNQQKTGLCGGERGPLTMPRIVPSHLVLYLKNLERTDPIAAVEQREPLPLCLVHSSPSVSHLKTSRRQTCAAMEETRGKPTPLCHGLSSTSCSHLKNQQKNSLLYGGKE